MKVQIEKNYKKKKSMRIKSRINMEVQCEERQKMKSENQVENKCESLV